MASSFASRAERLASSCEAVCSPLRIVLVKLYGDDLGKLRSCCRILAKGE